MVDWFHTPLLLPPLLLPAAIDPPPVQVLSSLCAGAAAPPPLCCGAIPYLPVHLRPSSVSKRGSRTRERRWQPPLLTQRQIRPPPRPYMLDRAAAKLSQGGAARTATTWCWAEVSGSSGRAGSRSWTTQLVPMASAMRSMSFVRSGSQLTMPSRSTSLRTVSAQGGAGGGVDPTSRGCVEKRTPAAGLVDKRGRRRLGGEEKDAGRRGGGKQGDGGFGRDWVEDGFGNVLLDIYEGRKLDV